MIALLDANVLIALTDGDHVHPEASESWLTSWPGAFASCPITQGALVRFLLRNGSTSTAASTVVRDLGASARHRFWSDDHGYDVVDLRGVVGHRQVTDAYLAGLARAHGGRLATLDKALAMLHPDVAVLVDAWG